MQKKGKFFFIFFIFLFLSLAILTLSFYGMLSGGRPFLEKTISFVPKTVYNLFQNLPFVSEGDEIKRLKDEKLELTSKLAEQEKLKKENTALLSQFQTPDLRADNLLPARVVGAPGFIPGVSSPSELILDKGERDNVEVGQSVVFKNNLVGRVAKSSYYLSKVELVTNTSVTFSAETTTGATGILKGGGEDKMTMNNILPSEELKMNDLVITHGDVDMNGGGIPPNLIVGKIESIEKIPTAIFQKAEISSLLDFNNLSIVFILIKEK
jgi:rod shape-determining protein MreC